MSKELEKVKKIRDMVLYNANGYARLPNGEVNLLIAIANNALHRLEAIDNANPSEALKDLAFIKEKFAYLEYNSEAYNVPKKELFNIEQALLKAQEQEKVLNEALKLNSEWAEELDYYRDLQEPKHYLKWEDLDFSEEAKGLNVKMNNNDYILRYTLDVFGGKCCFLYDNARNHHIELTKQFFNDLHLERVEE